MYLLAITGVLIFFILLTCVIILIRDKKMMQELPEGFKLTPYKYKQIKVWYAHSSAEQAFVCTNVYAERCDARKLEYLGETSIYEVKPGYTFIEYILDPVLPLTTEK